METGNLNTYGKSLFAFETIDAVYVDRVKQAVRQLLQREDITPSQIVSIGRTLHALGRLPLRTRGIDIYIELTEKGENGAQSFTLQLNWERFATESGGWIDMGVGSDSFSGTTFGVEPNFREYEGISIHEESWPDVFAEMTTAELNIEDNSDDEQMDWENPDGSEFWGQLDELDEEDND